MIIVVCGATASYKTRLSVDLAKKYNTTMDSLMEINELEGPESLTEGKKIIIPGKCKF